MTTYPVTLRPAIAADAAFLAAMLCEAVNWHPDRPPLPVAQVLADPKLAGMEISIQWPYGSNLHCEILVDDQIVAKADQFIAPRLLRPKDDPLYGVLQCGAPLDLPVRGAPPPTDAPLPPA
jgi:hypothetical protein